MEVTSVNRWTGRKASVARFLVAGLLGKVERGQVMVDSTARSCGRMPAIASTGQVNEARCCSENKHRAVVVCFAKKKL